MSNRRRQEQQAFLTAHGYGAAEVVMVAGDASFRKYYRITQDSQTYILMDAPPEHEDIVPFVGVANCLAELGYSAPGIHAMDREYGFLLLGDLGDDSFNKMIERDGGCEQILYENAVDLLCEMQSKTLPESFLVDAGLNYDLQPYSSDTLLREAKLLPEWTMASLAGADAARDAHFDTVFIPLLEQVSAGNQVMSLRDYHVDNLMWLPTRSGLARVGLLDFQDALIGHPAYDLVSLLQDARRDVSPALEEAMITRFIAKSGVTSEESFRAAYAILGAQRNAKIVGIFTRLYLRDGKDAYLPLIPRVWSLLERNFWLADLAPLQQWVEDYVPLAWRREVMRGDKFEQVVP